MNNLSVDNDSVLLYWLGSPGTIHNVIKDYQANGIDQAAKTIEDIIHYRLSNDDNFFADVVEGGTCEEDFDFILCCIHKNEQGLSQEEWNEAYEPYRHITTHAQVAYEYYGRYELIFLISQWYSEPLADRIAEVAEVSPKVYIPVE